MNTINDIYKLSYNITHFILENNFNKPIEYLPFNISHLELGYVLLSD